VMPNGRNGNQLWEYILDFAQLAQNENIELFCFGTELGERSSQRPEYWSQLIKKIKKSTGN
jgi:hypothetical protein